MSLQYRDAIGKGTVLGYSMRPRDALKRILTQLDAAQKTADPTAIQSHLAEMRRLTELGLAFNREAQQRAPRP
jgi:hypothetical protein